MTTNFLRRDLNFAESSTPISSSDSGVSDSRRASGFSAHLTIPTEDHEGYFGDVTYESPAESEDPGLMLRRLPRMKSADHGFHWNASEHSLLHHQPSDQEFLSPADSVSSLGSVNTSYDPSSLLYDRIIDTLISEKPSPFQYTGPRNLLMFDPSKNESLKNESAQPLMIKRLKISSAESQMLHGISHQPLRDDPWNAFPHILGVVDRGEWTYLCMKQLSEYNNPPLKNVEHYVDFFQQVLERLFFLHEHGISGLSLSDPSSYMMDLSSAPPTLEDEDEHGDTPRPTVPAQFNRHKYPVRYYFVNFSKATRLPRQSSYQSSPPPTPNDTSNPFMRDVRECGTMFERLLSDVPQIAKTFEPLIGNMSNGCFTLDHFNDLRSTLDLKSFQTLAKAVESQA